MRRLILRAAASWRVPRAFRSFGDWRIPPSLREGAREREGGRRLRDLPATPTHTPLVFDGPSKFIPHDRVTGIFDNKQERGAHRALLNRLVKQCPTRTDSLEHAVKLMVEFERAGFIPNHFACRKFINLCRGKKKGVETAEWFVRSMKLRGQELDCSCYNGMLDVVLAARQTDKFQSYLRQMRDDGVPPSRETYGLVMTSYLDEPNGVERGEGLLQRLSEAGPEPDAFLYQKLMALYKQHGLWERMDAAFERLWTDPRYACSIGLANSVIDSCVDREDGFARAQEVLHEMEQAGKQPNEFTYKCVIRLLCRGHDLDLLEEWLRKLAASEYPVSSQVVTIMEHRLGNALASETLVRAFSNPDTAKENKAK